MDNENINETKKQGATKTKKTAVGVSKSITPKIEHEKKQQLGCVVKQQLACEKKAQIGCVQTQKLGCEKDCAAKQSTGHTLAKKESAATKAKSKPDGKKVLFCSSEVLPFAATGGLGEVAGSLPQAINAASDGGYDVRVIMPLYTNQISQETKHAMKFMGNITVNLAWRKKYCGVFELKKGNVIYYFIDSEDYFKRGNLYGEYDDGERFAFFSKAILDVLPLIKFFPNVLHCNDWQTALVPVYYKLYYMYLYRYENMRTVFTIHNIEYQGKFGYNACEDLFGVPSRECGSISFDGCINLMKGAIDYCDCLTTVSPTYAQEIQFEYFSHGLSTVINKNKRKLVGILNGIDTLGYDSRTDKSMFVNFDEDSLDKKSENKVELQKMLGLTQSATTPMVAMITRLVSHKGVDLVKYAIKRMLAGNVQFVVLGTGNAEYEAFFRHLQSEYPGKVSAIISYNKDLSRKIYGACDIFLMPSKSEPCGLSQMIASRYGSVPVVREVGGLVDSIKDYESVDEFGESLGNGFTFATFNGDDMLNAIDRALKLYFEHKDEFRQLQKRILQVDFSWESSAKEYIKTYDGIVR